MLIQPEAPDHPPRPDLPPACAQIDVLHVAGHSRILIFPNRSLSPAGLRLAFGACLLALLPAVLTGIAFGAWPVLPFLGLEAAVIVGAFVSLRRHHGDYEEITLDGERVAHRRVTGPRQERNEFPRYWVRVVVEPDGRPFRPVRLWLRSHGQRIELARDAGEATRRALADVLVRDGGLGAAP